MSEWDRDTRRADVVILTAIRLEFDAVRKVDAGAVPGSIWEEVPMPSGLPVAFRPFVVASGRPLRVALAVAADMGATAALHALLPLVKMLKPRCIAMCGVCAGRRGKVNLGDVIAADRLYYHDTGKQTPEHVQQDLKTYNLRDAWKVALEGMDPAAHFRAEPWFHPFRLHVAPMGSGTRVIEDESIWSFVTQAMRKTLGIEMEAAVVGDLAHRQPQHDLDWLVMKGVMDFADQGRDDRVKELAARASAECLLWFLREHVATDLVAGFDDLLTSGTQPLPSSTPSSPGRAALPSFLLDARHTVVPWHDRGRIEIMADLDAWADTSTRVTVRLVHAEGGVGKTRLAIEWVRRRRERYELAGFLAPKLHSAWLERLRGLGPPVAIVIDYAETRSDLLDVLERLAALASVHDTCPRVHVLLLARSKGDWWVAMRRRSTAIAALLREEAAIELAPLAVSYEQRTAVFLEAARVFAAVRNRPPPTRPPIALDDVCFDRVLYLHMAALAAVEDVAFNAGSLVDVILDHEERFWIREARARDTLAVDVPLARQLVAAATIRGGLTTRIEACDVCSRLEGRGRTREDDALLALLHDVYEATHDSSYLPGLEPDLLGEGIVLRLAASHEDADKPAGGAWIERVLIPGDRPHVFTTAFTVLGRVSATNAAAIQAWIVNLLRSDLPTRAVFATRAAKAVGKRTTSSLLGDLLADALQRNGSASIAHDLKREGIPRPTVSLRRVAEWQSRMLLEEASSDPAAYLTTKRARWWNPATWLQRSPRLVTPAVTARARRLIQHGIDLSDLGRREEAFAATREAAALYRTLAANNPEVFTPDLAKSLNNLGAMLSALGQCENALAATQEAVDMRRRLAANNPEGYAPDLAASLNNLGMILSELGHRERAFAATQEAVGMYRMLAVKRPGTFAPDLARSLNNLGVDLCALGQRERALAATQEAVCMCRALATKHPDVFAPDLARSLNSLGLRLSEHGQRERALEATQEAVGMYRALAAKHPDAFAAHLAGSLNNLGLRWSELGHRERALEATQEAVDMCRALAAVRPDAFASDLALSLTNVGIMLSALGQHDRALAATREAVDMRRALAAKRPDAFSPDLARSLNNLGNLLSKLSQHERALAATQEAVEMYRALAAKHPDVFAPDLAGSLNNLGLRLSELGQLDRALAATQEAVDTFRALAAIHPDAFVPDLAMGLTNLGNRWSELGQRDRALAAAQEAVDIYRALAVMHSDAFAADLATSLSNLGIWLSALGQRDRAIAAMQEAVDIYRALAAMHPDAFAPDLARSSNNLGTRLNPPVQDEHPPAVRREPEKTDRSVA